MEAATSERRLRGDLRRAERRGRLAAIILIGPLFLFLLVVFVAPMSQMLLYSIENGDFRDGFPDLAQTLEADRSPVPGEEVFATLARELALARQRGDDAKALKPMRHQSLQVWRLLRNAKLPQETVVSNKEWFIEREPQWANVDTWELIRRVAKPYTDYYVLNALDLERKPTGEIVPKPPSTRLYLKVILNTFEISVFVTLTTLVLAYPVAYWLAQLPEARANALLILILLPFWTSLLVRCYAWLMLLQTNGVVNSALLNLELLERPLKLVHNRIGVYFAMTHIQLPFMLLPIYSVMKGISPHYVKAAANLGASPVKAFLTVYLPLSGPGIVAGCLLVFIISLGYYITPALVGGPRDAMISVLIALNINQVVNWGMAGALGTLLLLATLATFFVFMRLVRFHDMKLG